jgi:SagB-type dehydrogenase family enzyme
MPASTAMKEGGMIPVEDGTTLPLLYHLNSEPWMNLEAYAQHSYEVEFKQEAGEALALPAPGKGSQLMRLLAERGSCRRYAAREMALETVSTLLVGAYGLTRLNRLDSGIRFHSRPVPSAGGLYPLELYVMTRQVIGAPDGIYHFEAATNRLRLVQPFPPHEKLVELFLSQYFLDNANVLVMISAVFPRTLRKYGARGYRYVLLEAGHVAQTVCLLATEQNLGSLCMGGFWDARLNRFLKFDGTTQAVVYCVGVGHPAQP